MPAKSRRRQRIVPSGRKWISPEEAISGNNGAKKAGLQPKNTPDPQSKGTAALEPASRYLAREMKWIGAVTLIIIAVLIVMYVLLK